MAIQIGDQVYVPRKILELDEDSISPFYRTTVRARRNRSIQVDLPNGRLSNHVATSKVAINFGVLIVRIGDFNEAGLLDPLADSILQYCRMLLPGDSVRQIQLRTENELERLWGDNHGMCHQVVLIGHGSPGGFTFGEAVVSPARLVEILLGPQPSKKEFISLGCRTGYASFGGVFSSATCVSHYFAPFHSIHGCVASLFTQTFLHERLLAACSPKVAFNHARQDLLGAASFRLWENGRLTGGPK
jgi:hypothetical protein